MSEASDQPTGLLCVACFAGERESTFGGQWKAQLVANRLFRVGYTGEVKREGTTQEHAFCHRKQF